MSSIQANCLSEFMLNYCELINPSDVNDYKLIDGFIPNLYFILGIKKYYFSNDTKIIDKKNGKLFVKLESEDGEIIECNWTVVDQEKNLFKNLTMEISMDKRVMIVNGVDKYPVDYFYLNNLDIIPKFRILYIGQAFGGSKNKRNAIDRLKNHDKLQKILADCISSKLKYDVKILLLDLNQLDLFTTLGKKEDSHYELEFENNFYEDFPSKAQMINIVEALLINYFKPEYNRDFVKGAVPCLSHSSYNEFYRKQYELILINLQKLGDIELYTDVRTIFPIQEFVRGKILANNNAQEFISNSLKMERRIE